MAAGNVEEVRGVGDTSYDVLWDSLLPIGRDPATGGYHRLAYTDAELGCREWFRAAAADRGLETETDRNGNLWAWWTGAWGGSGDPDAVVVGSHLDSVRDGGAFDGPLGVVSAFAALDRLRRRGVAPARPVAVVAFSDEEGARFGIACAGSRLMTGRLDADRARGLRDDDGTTMAAAMAASGHDPRGLGRDEERVARIGVFVELHVEQGRGLVDLGAQVGLASSIWPHGRYRFTFSGQANHAGTTLMSDRRDPVQAWARTTVQAEALARVREARATFGRFEVTPNSTNAIPSSVRAWLDARAADEEGLELLVDDIRRSAESHARSTGTTVEVTAESTSPAVGFDASLRERLGIVLRSAGDAVPVLPTGAGHDAGVLASAGVPAAMLFVRNPTGVSHSPQESAERADCLAGVDALARVVEDLVSG